jgi:hypothetical protein
VSGQRHAPAALYPRERNPGTHCTGGWVDLSSGLDTQAGGKILCLCGESNTDRPVVQSVVRHYTELPRLLPQMLAIFNELAQLRLAKNLLMFAALDASHHTLNIYYASHFPKCKLLNNFVL